MKGIMIVWGTPIAGRERLALEEFASYTQWATALKAQDKIARAEHYMPHFGNYERLAGFSVLEGTESQINTILASEDFRARLQRVLSVVHNVRCDSLDVGEEVTKRLKLYGSSIQQLKL